MPNFGIMKKGLKIILYIVAATAIIAICGGVYVWNYINLESKSSGMIYVYPDASHTSVGDSIAGIIDNDYGKRVSQLINILNRGMAPRSGAYKIEKGDKAIDVAKKIKNGAQTPVNITFNNARTLDEFAEKVSSGLRMNAKELKEAAIDSAFLASMNITEKEVSAVLIPDTYNVYWTITPSNLLKKLTDSYNSFWNDERKNKAQKEGLTPIQVATLASIVEEETNNRSEQPAVARLYLNRLHKGMLLQADPTVKFALGDFGRKRILNADLEFDSPYNTYKYAGLPPGPIRIAEKKTIDAVLNAPDNNYLYMCAKEDFSGMHNFATNLATHNANAAKYRQALNKRGIKK